MVEGINFNSRLQTLVVSARAWSGTVYRSSAVRYANERELLVGTGASLGGGRWNPKGVEAVYGSMTPETCLAETLSLSRYYGLDASELMPRVFAAITVSLSSVLDLTAGSVRQKLGVSLKRMLGEDWIKAQASGRVPMTQAIGRSAAATGYEGLIVFSAAEPGGRNLVWFPRNLRASSRIAICNVDQLRR